MSCDWLYGSDRGWLSQSYKRIWWQLLFYGEVQWGKKCPHLLVKRKCTQLEKPDAISIISLDCHFQSTRWELDDSIDASGINNRVVRTIILTIIIITRRVKLQCTCNRHPLWVGWVRRGHCMHSWPSSSHPTNGGLLQLKVYRTEAAPMDLWTRIVNSSPQTNTSNGINRARCSHKSGKVHTGQALIPRPVVHQLVGHCWSIFLPCLFWLTPSSPPSSSHYLECRNAQKHNIFYFPTENFHWKLDTLMTFFGECTERIYRLNWPTDTLKEESFWIL